MTRTRWLISGALVVVSAVGVLWFSRTEEAPVADRSSIERGVATDTTSTLQAQAEPSVRLNTTMAALAATSKDLRAFVERAKQQPEAGGIAYAYTALMFCSQVRRDASRFDKKANAGDGGGLMYRQLRARDLLFARCAAFTDDELDLSRVAELYRSGIGRDPIVTMRSAVQNLDPDDAVLRRELAVRALSMRDPQTIASLPALLGERTETGLVLYVDKSPFGGLTPAEFTVATSLASCRFGDECGPEDTMVMVTCAQEGLCVDSREALYANAPGLLQPNRLQAVLRVRDQLVRAIDEQDLTVFSRP